ncbi:MAG: tyrosine-type recombinase/integrase [Anaerolineales bacterium]|nr:tyrosine-type recombinase/integrase [Anaerolineales bacterium]
MSEELQSSDSPLTFLQLYQDFYDQRASAQVSEGTLGIYGYTVRRFCIWADKQGLDPSTVERKHVSAYIAILSTSGYQGKATVNLHGRNIRAMLRFGYLEGLCPKVDFTGLLPRPPKKKQIVARRQDIEKLLAQKPSLRDKAIMLIMFESGIRKKETSDLNWGDLDFSLEDVVRIRVRSGKGDKDRVTFVGIKAKASLLQYMFTVPHEPNDPVFISRFGIRLGIQGIDRLYIKYSKLAGIKVTPHSVRRGFAVEHRKMGVWDLQRLMGHALVETTRLYVQTDESDLLESYRAYEVTYYRSTMTWRYYSCLQILGAIVCSIEVNSDLT